MGWQASFPGLCLDGYRGALVFPEPAKGKTKFGFDLRSKFRFRLARRIESNQIGVDQTGLEEDPFSTLFPGDLIGSRRRLLGDFVTGYFNGTRREPSIYSVR